MKLRFKITESKQKYTSDQDILDAMYELNNIKFYEKLNGECPVEEFLLAIENNKLVNSILYDMKRLDVLTYTTRPPLSEYVEDGIYELRTKSGSDISRAFYFFLDHGDIVFTNAYIKKQQKISIPDLELAKKYREDYMKNNKFITEKFFLEKYNFDIRSILQENYSKDLTAAEVCGTKYLYHATTSKNVQSIKNKGLLVNPTSRAWNFSNNVICLASDIEEAASYVEESDNYNDESIYVFTIDLQQLDGSSISVDSNIRYDEDDEITCWEYSKDIPPSAIIKTIKYEG